MAKPAPLRRDAGARIRIAVAGLGRIGWDHCTSLAKHPDFELVAVADPKADRRKEAQDISGCAAFGDYCEMLDRAELDAVVIATPTHFHRDMAVAALCRGLHVLLEKPMAANFRDAQAIARAAQWAGCVLTVYQPHRVMAYFQHLKRLVDSGMIGRVTQVKAACFDYVRRDDWQSLRKYGGGMLNNYCPHYIDLMLQLIGHDIAAVSCHLQRIASLGDAEDVVKVTMQTKGGVIGDIDINQASVINPYELIVWGTCGAIAVERRVELKVRRFDPAELPPKRLNRRVAAVGRQYPSENIAFVNETIAVNPDYEVNVYTDLARAIRTKTPPIVRPEEPLAVMKIMERCRKAAGRIAVIKR